MIQDPARGNIGYADGMMVTDFSEDEEELLEERPGAPGGQDDVKVFLLGGC